MSVWGNVKYAFKKGSLMLWGPADLDPRIDPNVKLDREHEQEASAYKSKQAKDWDKG